MSDFLPPSNVDLDIRPVNKGMILDSPGQAIPDGSWITLENFIANKEGPRRRNGYQRFANNDSTSYRMLDMITLWKTDGSQETILITDKVLYHVGPITGLTEVAWTYSTGTVAVAGTAVTGSGTAWSSTDYSVMSGDIFRCGTNEAEIASVDSATGITLKTSGGTHSAGASYTIQRAFHVQWPNFVDYARNYNKLILCDGSRPIMVYDADTGDLGYYVDPNRVVYSNSGTVTVSTTTVTGSSTTWLTDGIVAGDIFTCGSDVVEISSVNSDTSITLVSTGGSHAGGSAYSIARAESGYGILKDEFVVPYVVGYFLNRAWIAYTDEDTDGVRRQRIRWDRITVPSDFSTTTNWMEVNETGGSIKRLIPNGNVLVAYLDDGIYFLTQTNLSLLPLKPVKVETGGIGLVGQRAVCTWMGGHFFVGQDDIYYLGANGIESIGSPIIRSALKDCAYPEEIQVAADPANNRVLFGFPGTNKKMAKIWNFDYRSKTWSYEVRETYMIANPILNITVTWNDLVGTDWNDLGLTYPSWNQIRLSSVVRNLYIESNGVLLKGDPDSYLDWNGVDTDVPIQAVAVTKDFDLDNASVNKVFLRFAMKIEEEYTRTLPIVFLVEVSVNKGRSWKRCGNLTVAVDKDEGYVNFRASGSTGRFRLTTSSSVASYYIGEVSLRVGKSGDESRLGNQNT